jgi:hypothetical protein
MNTDKTFDLVVIQPVKNKPGKRVCGLTLHADNISSAIKRGREMFDGSGYAVMQAAQFNRHSDTEDQTNGEVTPVAGPDEALVEVTL